MRDKVANILKGIKEKFSNLRKKLTFAYREYSYKKIIKKIGLGSEYEKTILFTDSQLSEQQELDSRNHLYSELLKSYVEQYIINQGKKNRKKWHFFGIVMFAFLAYILSLLVMLIILPIFLKGSNTTFIFSYIATLSSIISSLIIIPHTIVKYLFNPKEDEIVSQLVTDMQKNDIQSKQIITKKASFGGYKKCRVKRRK